MSVNYRVVTRTGRAYIRYVCFGLLNRYRSISEGISSRRPDNNDSSFIVDTTPKDVVYLEYDTSQEFNSNVWSGITEEGPSNLVKLAGETHEDAKNRALMKYYQHMQEAFKDLTMYKGLVTFHPEQKVIRFHVEGHQSDKIMTAMFFIRNMHQHPPYGYFKLRVAGFSEKDSMLFSHILDLTRQTPFSNSRVIFPYISESSLFDTRTLGRDAIISLFRQDSEYSPWVQPLFNESRNGYLRDSAMNNNRRYLFKEDAPRHLKYRTLITCFSKPEDVAFHPQQPYMNSSTDIVTISLPSGMTADDYYSSLLNEILSEI